MERQKGITLIALIITIIVMLILVGVTINVAMNGGLFPKAQDASDKTTIAAEKEKLWMAAMAAIGENGEIDFAKLDANLPEGFSGSNGRYTLGENTYNISNKGKITQTTKNEGATSESIAGTYILMDTLREKLELYEDNKGKLITEDSSNHVQELEVTYTYDSNTKQGIMTIPEPDMFVMTFEYVEIIENNSIINRVLMVAEESDEESDSDSRAIFTTNQGTGLIPLTGNIYKNENNTIEFTQENENGFVTFKTNGETINSAEINYVLFNGMLLIGGKNISISQDYSTITTNDSTLGNIVYTKQ